MIRKEGGTKAGGKRRLAFATGIAALLPALLPGMAHAQLEWNLQTPVTPIARQMFDLHSYIFWICVAIFILVFGVMFYSIFKHRKSVGHQAAQFHENTTVEIVWTVIPFLILLFMAWPATKTVLAMKDTSAPDVTIKVTGYQWKWGYDYLQDGFGFYSNLSTPRAQIEGREARGPNYLLEVDNPLVVPVESKVRVIITANDVLHSWWVPAFGVKQDAIPGFVRDTWFRAEKVGTFRGQCAELCGKEHAFMPIVVEVKSKEDYAKWVGEQKQRMASAADDPGKAWTEAELVAKGAAVYAANCAACHQSNGKGMPPAFPPLDGSKVVTGAPADQIHIVLNGKPGTAMPPWKQLSDVDIASVITYTRNSWGNKAGEVLPAAIKAAR
jgi:cytochrome c oxidase subunit 2